MNTTKEKDRKLLPIGKSVRTMENNKARIKVSHTDWDLGKVVCVKVYAKHGYNLFSARSDDLGTKPVF